MMILETRTQVGMPGSLALNDDYGALSIEAAAFSRDREEHWQRLVASSTVSPENSECHVLCFSRSRPLAGRHRGCDSCRWHLAVAQLVTRRRPQLALMQSKDSSTSGINHESHRQGTTAAVSLIRSLSEVAESRRARYGGSISRAKPLLPGICSGSRIASSWRRSPSPTRAILRISALR